MPMFANCSSDCVRLRLPVSWYPVSDRSEVTVPKSKDAVSVRRARTLSKKLLRQTRERWQHTSGVAARAAELADTVDPVDRRLLLAAAWLHDIGYAPTLRKTGFHPLDGGLYLRDHKWDQRLTALVAHHSGARFVPVERGFADLMSMFPFEDSSLSMARLMSPLVASWKSPPLR